jgi:glycosyltransferase involved in cell wall biosynthesis
MLVSVVVTTKNEEKCIDNCLHSIKEQTYPQDLIEIIVIDNNSSDRTKEIASKYTNKVFDICERGSSNDIINFRGAQLNYGVYLSSGEIIFFPDADMTFDIKLISEAVFLLNRYDALYVPEIILSKGLFGLIRNFDRAFYNQTCIDAVRFVKKSVFQSIGGYDEVNVEFGSDDWDFTKLLIKEKKLVSITNYSLYHNEIFVNFSFYITKKCKYLEANNRYILKWGNNDIDIKKQFGLFYRFFGVYIENGKWKRLISHPFLFLGCLTVKISLGVVFVIRKIVNKI